MVSGSADKTIKLWDAASGALIHTFEGHTGSVNEVAFSPDGTRVLSGSDDGTLKLWDATTGKRIRTFHGHSDRVLSVAFSPDGTRAVSGSWDSTVRIWNLKDDRQAKEPWLVSLIGARDGEWLAMTPAGFFNSSPKGTELLGVSQGLKSYAVTQFYDRLYRPALVSEALKGDKELYYEDRAFDLDLAQILASGPTPRLDLLKDQTQWTGNTVHLEVRITDEGGGIGPNIYWRVNGQTMGNTANPEPDDRVSPGNYVIMTQDLPIDLAKKIGDPNKVVKTEFEVVAYNKPGALESLPLKFSVDQYGITDEERPHLYVLAAGVTKYLNQSDQLPFAAKDATDFGDAMAKVGRSMFEDRIHVVKLPRVNEEGVNEEATKQNLLKKIEQLSPNVQPRDVFVLYLSGHGRAVDGHFVFLPQDYDVDHGQRFEDVTISDKELTNWLAKIHAKNSVLILDACHSGAGEFPAAADTDRDLEKEGAMNQLIHSSGRNTIAAAGEKESAYEGYHDHGLMTYVILEAMNKAPNGPDDAVYLLQIGSQVEREVPLISKSVFKIEQDPKVDLRTDFRLGDRQPVLKEVKIEIGLAYARHSVEVRASPSDSAAIKESLSDGDPVTVSRKEGDWYVLEQDGEDYGYVPTTALLIPKPKRAH